MTPPTNPYQPQDSLENDPPADVLLDSLLSEWLGGDAPRDQPHEFEAISVAAQNQRFGKALFSDHELLAAANKAWEETQFDATLVDAQYTPYHARTEDTVAVRREHLFDTSHRQPQYAKWSGLVLAASLLGVLLGYPLLRWRDSSPTSARSNSMEFPKLGSGSDNLFPTPTPPVVADAGGSNADVSVGPSIIADNSAAPKMETSTSTTAGDVSPSTNTLAIRSDSPQRNDASATGSGGSISESSQNSIAQSPLGSTIDQQTVEVIDDQLRHLWRRLKIAPSKTAEVSTLENRFAEVLVGRLPTAAEREWARQVTGTGKPMDEVHALVRRWIDSDEFDRHWSQILSDYYLDSTLAIEQTEAFHGFVGWLQQEIGTTAPLATTERKLISSDLSGNTRESYWLKRWLTVGKNAPARLLASASQKAVGHSSEQLAALETVALQGIRLSGQSVAACAQCHRQMDAQEIPHPGMAVAGIQNESMFGTASALVGLLNTPLMAVEPSTAKKSEFYASDAEGKVSLIAPTLPNGRLIEAGQNARQAVAQWFEDNSRAREPVVDYVWLKMLGQPLVPKVGLTEDEGLVERRDLLEFLANQVQKERAGLKQLVYWIAMASPMSVEVSALDADDFLKQSPTSLATLQLQRRVFNKYVGARPSLTTAGQLESVSRWLQPQPSTNQTPGLLAQPSAKPAQPSSPSNTGSTDPTPVLQWNRERMDFEMSNAHPYGRVQDLSTALAASPMEWSAVVDHAFLVCLARYPSDQERKQASELLTWSSGDRKSASARLLNALLGQL
jgi:hypothetical protein